MNKGDDRKSLFARLRALLTGRGAKPRRKGWKSDLALGALGVTLGLGCAYFPWYIFHNPEKFGVRAMRFEGFKPSAPSAGIMPTASSTPPLTVSEVPVLELDLFATGTVEDGDDGGRDRPRAVLEQPFPTVAPPYRVVHIANGRAMVEDDTGIYVVGRGDRLPDASRVASVEQRDGAWVVVTDDKRVLTLSR
ncbi:MAG: hypothetical protein K5872_12435 [Rhizobiaceae bacterium]|nr:hypothetical protein [Rhizobiaceae bacterium]MCV0407025.1 hypothetical protein [Rhizobiaceae bacterium]